MIRIIFLIIFYFYFLSAKNNSFNLLCFFAFSKIIFVIFSFFKTILSIMLVEMISIMSGVDTTIMAAGANLATTLATMLCFAYLYHYYKSFKTEIAWEIKSTVNHKPTRIRKT